MKKEAGAAVLVLTTMLANSTSSADDWKLSISPMIDLAYKTADISKLASSAGNVGFHTRIQPSYKTITPSLGASYGPFYALVSYDSTIEGWNSESTGVAVPGYWSMYQDSYERNEASATVGYRIFHGNQMFGPVSVFGGYLQGTSVWRENVFTGSMAPTPFPVFGTAESKRSYVESGYFLGVNYAHSFSDKGTLAVSAAYAFLDGTLNDMALLYNNLVGTGGTYVNTDYQASSRGLSLGMVWVGPITGNLSYRVGTKYVNYKFPVTEKRDNLTGIVTPVSGETISEQVLSFFLGVSSFF